MKVLGIAGIGAYLLFAGTVIAGNPVYPLLRVAGALLLTFWVLYFCHEVRISRKTRATRKKMWAERYAARLRSIDGVIKGEA